MNMLLDLTFSAGLLGMLAYFVVRSMRNRFGISVSDVTSWFVLLYFGMGPWVTFAYSGEPSTSSDFTTMLMAYAAVAIFVIALRAPRWYADRNSRTGLPGEAPRVSAFVQCIHNAADCPMLMVVGVFVLVVLLRFYLGVQTGLFFAGDKAKAEDSSLGFLLTSVYYTIAPTLGLATLVWAIAAFCRRSAYLPISLVLILGNLGLAFVQGRRPFILAISLALLTFYLIKGLRLRNVLLVALAAFLLLEYCMPLFQIIRAQRSRMHENAVMAVVEATKYAIDHWGDSNFEESYRHNMGTRANWISFNCVILEAQQSHEVMKGYAMLDSIVMALPNAIMPDKRSWSDPEALICDHYTLFIGDPSVSYPAMGIADFGALIGPIVYGLFLGCVIVVCEGAAGILAERFRLLSLCLVITLFISACEVESTPTLLLSSIRSILMLIIPAMVLWPLSARRSPAPVLAAAGGWSFAPTVPSY